MRRVLLLILGVVVALIPAAAFANDSGDHGGFAMRMNGDYTVAQGDSLNALVVIKGDATVDGTVHDTLLVVNGDATVNGTVDGDVRVVNGTLTLAGGANVKNVQLVRSELVRQPGAIVSGSIERNGRFFFSAGWVILFGFVLFIGLGVALLALAAGFAVVGGKQLSTAAVSLAQRPGQTILAGFITVLALPIAGALLVASVVGFWIGMGIFFVLIPLLTALGYVTAGTWLGRLILQRAADDQRAHPLGEALLGTLLVLVLFLLPGINALALVGFAIWGAGGLTYTIYRGWRGEGTAIQPAPASPAGGAAQTS